MESNKDLQDPQNGEPNVTPGASVQPDEANDENPVVKEGNAAATRPKYGPHTGTNLSTNDDLLPELNRASADDDPQDQIVNDDLVEKKEKKEDYDNNL